jgi:glycosyltransferase involved in cell wall biosynthesis
MNRIKSAFSDSGYPAKLGEYLACKRPILMSDCILFSSDFQHKKEVIKYKHDDPTDLANAILYRYKNLNEMIEMADRGHLFAKDKFDSENISTKLVELATKLVESI